MSEMPTDKPTTDGPTSTSEGARIIKRYANRKLYDTHESRYVTLDQISELIRRGEEVKVIDNGTKDDLTSVTLAQIIFEEEKRQKSFLPLSVLRKIIQSSGESLHEIVSQIQESAERVGRRFRREDGVSPAGEAALAPGDPANPDPAYPDAANPDAANPDAANPDPANPDPANPQPLAVVDGPRSEPSRMIRDFVDGIQHTIDDWQRRVDENVHHAWETVSPLAPLQKEIHALRERILELEKRLMQASDDRDHAVPGPTSQDADKTP